MIDNPFLPSPSQAAAWSEGFTKGIAAIASPEPGENVDADDIEAFNQGVATGEKARGWAWTSGIPCGPASGMVLFTKRGWRSMAPRSRMASGSCGSGT
jgi:hypothetical protein